MEWYLSDSVTDFLVIPLLFATTVVFLFWRGSERTNIWILEIFARTLPNLLNCLMMHIIGVRNGRYGTTPQFSQKIAIFSLKQQGGNDLLPFTCS
jgi:hypothetical protein